MKFYQSGLESVVWNPERQAPLAEFKKPDFTFETNDPKVIERLQELGYQALPEEDDTEGGDGPRVTDRLRS